MADGGNTIHGKTLARNSKFLEKHLDPIKVILFDQEDLIEREERRGIASLTTKPEQNAAILTLVAQRGFNGYQKFLRILQITKQDSLRNILVKCERIVKLELQNKLGGHRPWSRSSICSRSRSEEGQRLKTFSKKLPPRPGSYTGEYLEDKIQLKNNRIRRLSTSRLSSTQSSVCEDEQSSPIPVYDPNVWDSSRPLLKCTDVDSSRDPALLVFGYRNSLGRIVNDILAIRVGIRTKVVKLGHLGAGVDEINSGITCCSLFNAVYISALGENCDNIWKFTPDTRQQEQCGQLYKPRMGHCMSVANGIVYFLGGCDPTTGQNIDIIEGFDPHGCVGFVASRLIIPVSRTCSAAVNNKIYVFGGYSEKMSTVNHVQCFDSITNQCVLVNPLCTIAGSLTPHVWGPLVYLIGKYQCMIYDTETQICVLRKGHGTGVDDFGLLTVDTDADRAVYVVGGRHGSSMSNRILGVLLRNISLGKQESWLQKDRLIHGIGMLKSNLVYNVPSFWFDQPTFVQHLQ